MDWIKSWSLIQDDKTYLVLGISRLLDQAIEFHVCAIPFYKGRDIKKRLQCGHYVAAEITLPASLEECR